MIPGFEKQTVELNKYELSFVPYIINKLSLNIGKKKAVTNSKICKHLQIYRGADISLPRFRKIVQYIRINGLIKNLIATSNGYFVASSRQECLEHIETMDKRINALITTRDTLSYQMKEKYGN